MRELLGQVAPGIQAELVLPRSQTTDASGFLALGLWQLRISDSDSKVAFGVRVVESRIEKKSNGCRTGCKRVLDFSSRRDSIVRLLVIFRTDLSGQEGRFVELSVTRSAASLKPKQRNKCPIPYIHNAKEKYTLFAASLVPNPTLSLALATVLED